MRMSVLAVCGGCHPLRPAEGTESVSSFAFISYSIGVAIHYDPLRVLKGVPESHWLRPCRVAIHYDPLRVLKAAMRMSVLAVCGGCHPLRPAEGTESVSSFAFISYSIGVAIHYDPLRVLKGVPESHWLRPCRVAIHYDPLRVLKEMAGSKLRDYAAVAIHYDPLRVLKVCLVVSAPVGLLGCHPLRPAEGTER